MSDEEHKPPRWLEALRVATPAPWYVDDAVAGSLVIRSRETKRKIAIILDAGLGEDEANAFLIASSPELREAVVGLLGAYEALRYAVGDHSRIAATVLAVEPKVLSAHAALDKTRRRP